MASSGDAYNQMVREKQIRISRLQLEIFNEAAKDPIDPMELGAKDLAVLVCKGIDHTGKNACATFPGSCYGGGLTTLVPPGV